jgi:hypothetical protein
MLTSVLLHHLSDGSPSFSGFMSIVCPFKPALFLYSGLSASTFCQIAENFGFSTNSCGL